MIPYADFTYFGLLLYAVVPTLILGLFGKAGWRWATLVTAVMLIVQYHGSLDIRPHFAVREIWIAIGFAVWQWATVCVFAKSGARAGWPFYVAFSLFRLASISQGVYKRGLDGNAASARALTARDSVVQLAEAASRLVLPAS